MSIHQNNRQRLIRFLNKENNPNAPCYPLYDAIYIGLTAPRDILYAKINDRVDLMFKEGLLEEAKHLYSLNLDCKALNTAIAYKELFLYFKGEITLEEAQELIKKRSRHYAKRQYTWFNHQMPIKWFDVNFNDFTKTIKEVQEYINNKT